MPQTQEEINTDLQGQLDDLKKKYEDLKDKPQELKISNKFKDIEFFQNLRVDNLILKYMETTTALKPSLQANQFILWKDTTLTKYYILANFNGNSKTIELT
jgi:hypothetical protein